MPSIRLLGLLLAAVCLFPMSAAAQGSAANSLLLKEQAKPAEPVVDGVTLDAPHTSTTFWIRHIVAPVAGRFDAVSGSITIPAQAPARGHVAFTVKTGSVDTGVAARDKHLGTPEFLDTATYPEMKFTSEHISPVRRGQYNVTGKLTIKDVTKTVTIPVKSLGTKPHPMMPCVDVSGYESQFSLNRLQYHVGTGKYFKMGAVGDTVDIRLAGETLAPRPGCVKAQ